ncbi:MAG: hypothetical protein ABEK12_01185, partial [Candidatus Nanohaloarchaea archaeon]
MAERVAHPVRGEGEREGGQHRRPAVRNDLADEGVGRDPGKDEREKNQAVVGRHVVKEGSDRDSSDAIYKGERVEGEVRTCRVVEERCLVQVVSLEQGGFHPPDVPHEQAAVP